MKKTIEFYERTIQEKGRLVSYEVDLERLSPLALRLAEGIYTTDKHDDYSLIYIEDTVPAYQRQAESKYNAWPESMTMEERIQNIKKKFGDMLDDPRTATYVWPQKQKEESPEEYLERCAKDIESHGWSVIQTATEKQSEVRVLRRRMNMTQAAFGEFCGGIPVRTIQDWEGKRRTPPEWVLNLIRWRVES